MVEWLKVSAPILLITAIGLVVAYYFVEPAPPGVVRFAAGDADGAYAAFAERYAEALSEDRIDVEIIHTAGSIDNLQLLQADSEPADIAFIQGGVTTVLDGENLTALASVFLEPLWVFLAEDHRRIRRLNDLDGLRLAVGAEGSGTASVVRQLLATNGITDDTADILAIGGRDAVEGLRNDKVDAMFIVSAVDSPLVQELLTSGQPVMSFSRADAYAQQMTYLRRLELADGAIDLEANIPPRPVTLIAPVASLVSRADLHPALVERVLHAAHEVHGEGDLFARPDHFPSALNVELPLHPDAKRYLERGEPFLQRYLPFWMANLIDRLVVMLIPLLTLFIPLVRVLPPVYRWRIRSRVYRWYKQVREVETEANVTYAPERLRQLVERLDRIDDEVRQIDVPVAYADLAYTLRLHIDMIRDRYVARIKGQPLENR
ncbi:MAG: TAXI family TRAP transporter solute-binding subunit [Geminicoccaceae bacterium]